MKGEKRPDVCMGVNHHEPAPRTMCHSVPSDPDTQTVPSNAQQVTLNLPMLRSLTIEVIPTAGF